MIMREERRRQSYPKPTISKLPPGTGMWKCPGG